MIIIVRDEGTIEDLSSYDESIVKTGDLKKGWQEKMLAVGIFYSKDNNHICSTEQIEQLLKSEGFIKWLAVN